MPGAKGCYAVPVVLVRSSAYEVGTGKSWTPDIALGCGDVCERYAYMKAPNVPQAPPTIAFASATGPNGAVYRGPVCSRAQAVAFRAAGNDIVVCDGSTADNRKLARDIEESVAGAGNVKEDPPHVIAAGVDALPHFQPMTRPPAGHCFFETNTQKAKSCDT